MRGIERKHKLVRMRKVVVLEDGFTGYNKTGHGIGEMKMKEEASEFVVEKGDKGTEKGVTVRRARNILTPYYNIVT